MRCNETPKLASVTKHAETGLVALEYEKKSESGALPAAGGTGRRSTNGTYYPSATEPGGRPPRSVAKLARRRRS